MSRGTYAIAVAALAVICLGVAAHAQQAPPPFATTKVAGTDNAWAGYETALPFVLRRYCGLWGRGT